MELGHHLAADHGARSVSHSAIRYVTPDERHHGRDRAVLATRHELYQRARRANPERWSGSTRNWSPVALVVLNGERAPQ